MSHFISWAEVRTLDKKGKIVKTVFFLDHEDAYETELGEKIRKYTVKWQDLCGHGSLYRYYSELHCATSHECENFENPHRFPPKIVEAIKQCRFVGIGYGLQLLNDKGKKLFKKLSKDVTKKYDKDIKKVELEIFAIDKIINEIFQIYFNRKVSKQEKSAIEKKQYDLDASKAKIVTNLYSLQNSRFYELTEIFWKIFKENKFRNVLWIDDIKNKSKKRAKVALCVN
jgi:hypothetical protein